MNEEPKYKIGDKLICLPGFNKHEHRNDPLGGGAGYKEGEKGIVRRISRVDNSGQPIYWFQDGFGGCGVYEPALKLYQPDTVINNYQIF